MTELTNISVGAAGASRRSPLLAFNGPIFEAVFRYLSIGAAIIVLPHPQRLLRFADDRRLAGAS